jgi:uncharacterized protein
MMELTDEGLEILDDHECLRLLGTVRIGRVAISRGAVPVVLPVTFALVGGEIMFFTGTGIKLNAALEGGTVAFEVDDIDVDSESGWSVLVVGCAGPASPSSRARAEALGLYPWAAGDRQQLVRIRPEFVSGRRLLK